MQEVAAGTHVVSRTQTSLQVYLVLLTQTVPGRSNPCKCGCLWIDLEAVHHTIKTAPSEAVDHR